MCDQSVGINLTRHIGFIAAISMSFRFDTVILLVEPLTDDCQRNVDYCNVIYEQLYNNCGCRMMDPQSIQLYFTYTSGYCKN